MRQEAQHMDSRYGMSAATLRSSMHTTPPWS